MAQFLWKTLQIGVFLSVLFANIYFEWGAGGYAASFLGCVAAAIATGLAVEIIDRSRATFRAINRHRGGNPPRLTGQQR